MKIAGVDEAGRGPLAGPVVAAAVILGDACDWGDIKDSKLLSPSRRDGLYAKIVAHALSVKVAEASVEEIERLNIHCATLLAMRRAVMALPVRPDAIQVDGKFCPDVPYVREAIVHGDKLVACIGAASIVAKVVRDRKMQALAKQYPGYGFEQHKGYATRKHTMALKRLGPCAIHRKTYAPVSVLLCEENQR